MAESYRYQQLESWLREGIVQRRWRAGDKLPSVRELCSTKQLSKATVQHAYQRLEAQGLIKAVPKSGYFVAASPSKRDSAPLHRKGLNGQALRPVPVNTSAVVDDIMRRGAAFDLLPDLQGLDADSGLLALNRAVGRALRQHRQAAHHYYDAPEGNELLREQLALRYQRLGVAISAADLLVTQGCQHGLFLALMACCEPGDVVAVESPGFYGSLQLLSQLKLKVLEIPADPANGIDVNILEEQLARWPVKACVVTPNFATPTGAVMPAASSIELVELANRYDFALIEDDIYGDLGFRERPEPLKALDTQERIILCSSLSKSLSRDLRLGWVEGARWRERIAHLKLITVLASSQYTQQGVADFIREGEYERFLRRQRLQLLTQRDQWAQAISEVWQDDVSYTLPEGGMALWVSLPESVDTLTAYNRALAEGIVITPGALFSTTTRFNNYLRISFAQPLSTKRHYALASLAAILRD